MEEKKKNSKRKVTQRKIRKNISIKTEMSLEELQKAMESKQVFDIFVRDVDASYNLIAVFANGIDAVMPREEVSIVTDENGLVDAKYCESRKEKIMQACIKSIELDGEEIKKIILSRKILEHKVRSWMYSNLKPGMRLFGVVTKLTDYAAYVDVGGGVKASLKVDEISHVKLQKPEEKLRVGQRITGVVKKYDKDTGKIELSMKDLAGDFKTRTKKLKEGDIVEATVRGRTKTGIFIELDGDISAMADHVSGIEYGQKVLVHIKRINEETERIRVSIIG